MANRNHRYRPFAVLISALVLSLLIHWTTLFFFKDPFLSSKDAKQDKTEKISLKIEYKERVKEEVPQEKPFEKKILETPLPQTLPPKTQNFRLGPQDHRALVETKGPDLPMPRQGDVGPVSSAQGQNQKQGPKQKNQKEAPKEKSKAPKDHKPSDEKALHGKKKNFRKTQSKEDLLNTVFAEADESLSGNLKGGYQDYLKDEKLKASNQIDLNTKDYRYIGYFSSLRKDIELVWVYPNQAVRKGLEGSVTLKFSIKKSGDLSDLRVVKSSGHTVLDQGILEALRKAAPFAPLPQGFDQDVLTVTGTFHYVLTHYAARAR